MASAAIAAGAERVESCRRGSAGSAPLRHPSVSKSVNSCCRIVNFASARARRLSAAVCGLLLLVSGCGGEAPKLADGDPAPTVVVETLAGERLDLPASLAGKVVAVRFWADWCRFCEKEMKDLEPLYRRLSERGFTLLAVNVGQERERVEHFVQRVGFSYPALLDPESQAARRYGVIALPTTFIVDRDGRIRGKILGESEPAVLAALVERLL